VISNIDKTEESGIISTDQAVSTGPSVSQKNVKAASAVVDMTEGSITGHIMKFALPMLLGYLFQQFYSMVDTIIVGKYIGVLALAGVGSTGAINFMVIGFCTGICGGFCIPVSQFFGAKDMKRMRRFIANSIWLSAAFALGLTILVCAFTGQILHLMNTQDDIYQYAYTYIFIVFAGIPATILYNLASSIIRSLGDSRTPVYFLLLSSGLNIVLDLASILVLGMGVEGPAIATVVSQLLSGLLCAWYLYRHFEIVRCSRDEMRLDQRCIKRLLVMGLPMGLQYSITAIGSVILQTAVNGLGYMAVAAVTAGNKIRMFFSTPYDALGGTMATYCGQNVGAARFDRVREGVLKAMWIGFAYSVVGIVAMVVLGDFLCGFFVDAGEGDIISMTKYFIIVNAAFGFFLTIVNVFRFAMQGMGFSGLAICAGVMEMIGRSLVAFALVPVFGFKAACYASPVAWIFADIFLIPACFGCIRRLKMMASPRR
jgi:putative MATE family efflux protein